MSLCYFNGRKVNDSSMKCLSCVPLRKESRSRMIFWLVNGVPVPNGAYLRAAEHAHISMLGKRLDDDYCFLYVF